jgi:hypothetical protein
MGDQVSHPYKTSGKIILLFLCFWLGDGNTKLHFTTCNNMGCLVQGHATVEIHSSGVYGEEMIME